MTTGIAVVGAGFWAENMHLPAFQRIAGAEVRCVVAATEQSARATAERFGIPNWSTDIAATVARDDIDLVDVVAPPHVHAEAVLLAAAAGKDAICIKPLGRTVAEAEAMIDAARAAGTRLFYAENVPFIPALQAAKRSVDAGAIGDVFRVAAREGIGEPHSAWFFDPARSGGGAVLDMAVHSIAFCGFFAGSEVVSVSAEVGTFVWGDRTTAEDTAVLTLRFADGAIGVCEDSWSLTGAMDSRFEIVGTGGRILIDNLHRQPIEQVGASGGWTYPLPIPGLLADGHEDMLRHFVHARATGAPSPSEGEAGLAVLRVVEAALVAAGTGQRQVVQHQTIESTEGVNA
jgi:predicted dehydrogenase